MTTPQLPPLPEQSMTHHITDELIFAAAEEHSNSSAGPVGQTSDFWVFEREELLAFTHHVLALAAPQGEPVAAQCRFEGDAEWKPCTVAHHLLVQAHQKEWPHYETRALYTAPAPAVPSDEREAFEAWKRTMLNGFDAWDAWQARAALTAAPTPSPAPAVPSGWKLVPVEPTRHMMECAEALPAIDPNDLRLRRLGWTLGACQNRRRYLQMLNAAPNPDQKGSDA